MEPKILFGIIADDFTGASDAASFAVKGGLQTILFNGLPKRADLPAGTEAVVVALKSRTQETEAAVKDSLQALAFLQALGADRIYDKYCSTFDSTPEGNIGPIADALLDSLDEKFTVLCPSLPVNGRTVKDGILYVDGIPLSETHMADHPLTPMKESFLPALMNPQSRYPCYVISREDLPKADLGIPVADPERYYIVPDYETDADGIRIIDRFPSLKLYTGGSGLVEHLARFLKVGERTAEDLRLEPATGPVLLVSGSLSEATQAQIQAFIEADIGKAVRMKPADLAEDNIDSEALLRDHNPKTPLLLYSSREPEDPEVDNAAELLENFFAAVAEAAVRNGYTGIIAAGGETSGAVTRALGLQAYTIGQSIAPGVPVMAPLEKPDLRLVLKSGNFGDRDFFLKAIREVRYVK